MKVFVTVVVTAIDQVRLRIDAILSAYLPCMISAVQMVVKFFFCFSLNFPLPKNVNFLLLVFFDPRFESLHSPQLIALPTFFLYFLPNVFFSFPTSFPVRFCRLLYSSPNSWLSRVVFAPPLLVVCSSPICLFYTFPFPPYSHASQFPSLSHYFRNFKSNK